MQSSSAITATSDKAKFLDAQAKITELERLLKVREHKARDEQARIKELEEHLHQDKLGSQKRVQELSDDLR